MNEWFLVKCIKFENVAILRRLILTHIVNSAVTPSSTQPNIVCGCVCKIIGGWVG